jgi:hypothetical protein
MVGIFADGCTLESVEAVCDTKGDLGLDVLEGMASLVNKSLVQQVEHVDKETRFTMLSTIREYALGMNSNRIESDLHSLRMDSIPFSNRFHCSFPFLAYESFSSSELQGPMTAAPLAAADP